MARFDGRPTRYDWTHVKGTDSKVVATFLDADSNPVDLSGLPITAVAYLPGYPAAAFAFTTVVSGASNSILTVTVADDATLPTRTKDDGTLDWALTIDFAAGRVLPIVAGSFTIVNPGEPDGQYASADALAVTVTTGDSMAVTVSTVVLAAGIPGIPDGGTAGQALSKVSGTNYDVNWVSVATAAQGAKADTATQPGDLGTAAAQDVGYFATAAQGGKADLAAPKASPTFTGTTTTAALTATGDVSLQNFVNFTRVGTAAQFAEGGVVKFTNGAGQNIGLILSNSGRLLISSLTETAFTGPAVTVPAPTASGHALRQGSNATVAALTATGVAVVAASTGSPALSVTGVGSSPAIALRSESTDASWAIQAAGAGLHFRREVDGVLSTIHAILKPSGEWAFDQPGTSVKVPVPTATGQALRQGSKAVIADATADGEALAHSQDGAVLKGLTIGGGGTYPRVSIDATIAGYLDFKKSGVGEFYISNGQTGGGRLSIHALAANRHPIEIQADGRLDLDDALAVIVPTPSATGHALRQGSNATVAALTAGSTVIDGGTSGNPLDIKRDSGSMTVRFLSGGVPAGIISASTSALTIGGGTGTGPVTFAAASSVAVPVPTTTGHALRQGSNATVDALTATGATNVAALTATGTVTSPNVEAIGALVSELFAGENSANGVKLVYDGETNRGWLRAESGGVDIDIAEIVRSNGQILFKTPTSVPAATAATHAAQVSAIDAATGRLAIGGREIGDTGWRNVASLLTTGWAIKANGYAQIRRVGNEVHWSAWLDGSSATGNNVQNLLSGFRDSVKGLNGAQSFTALASDGNLLWRVVTATGYSIINNGGAQLSGSAYQMSGSWTTTDPWPNSLPGVAA